MLKDTMVNSKNKAHYGVHASADKEYERKLTYCKRFHLLRSKHGAGNKGKERKDRVSVACDRKHSPPPGAQLPPC